MFYKIIPVNKLGNEALEVPGLKAMYVGNGVQAKGATTTIDVFKLGPYRTKE